ncbi:hypothetical protein KI387_019023, partial [Taxus chinensis]
MHMSGQSSVNGKVNSSQLVNNGPIALRHVAKRKKELFCWFFRSPVFDERKNGARGTRGSTFITEGSPAAMWTK